MLVELKHLVFWRLESGTVGADFEQILFTKKLEMSFRVPRRLSSKYDRSQPIAVVKAYRMLSADTALTLQPDIYPGFTVASLSSA